MGALVEPAGCVWRMSWPQADQKKNFPREYSAWNAARRRCHDPDVKAFPSYGGRGISVCPEWFVSFDAFLAYIGPRPSDEHSLDRIDNDRGYEPGNVRWATRSQQMANRRTAQQMASGMTPGQIRLAKANEVRMRSAEEKLAQQLRQRGWQCIPPPVTD